MIKYSQETRYYKLILKIDDITMSDWYDHSSFAVHADMKSYKGVVSTMVKGAIPKKRTKKKIITKIPIEA